ncbi:MAG TPA: redoxin domain-containing protein [Steroidobacteraceae bacterium]|nr:redoxin domain-containing protein [Steroidobacteraceae bacterium]
MTPVGRAVLGIVLVAGAGPAGFLLYHLVFNGSHQLPPPPANSAVSAPSAPTSAPLTVPDAPTQTTGTRTPQTLPLTVSLPDSAGTMHPLAQYLGHPLVLNFWATWCEPCRREIPLLQALHQERGTAVQIVGVAMDFQKDVLPYARSRGITYPLLMGEKDGYAAVNAFGMQVVLPFTVFADSRGDIVAVKVGELHADEARMILAKLSAVDAGKLGLSDARSAVSTELRNLALVHAQQAVAHSEAAGAKS